MPLLNVPSSQRLISIIGILIMAAAIAVIMSSGASIINKEGIEQRLQLFSVHVADEAAKQGREGKFSYGAIGMEGWGYSKYAVVQNVSLEIAERSVLDTTRWTFSTTRMLVMPDPVTASTLLFVFPEPVNVIENSQLRTRVLFSDPLRYSYFDGMEKQAHTIVHAVYLPPQVTLAEAHAVDSPAGKEEKIITYDPNPLVRLTVRPEVNEREGIYAFANLRITETNGQMITASSLVSRFSESGGEDGRPLGSYTLQVDDLALKGQKTYDINADVSYRGDMPFLTLKDWTPAAGETDITLNRFSVAGEDFMVKASGAFSRATNDPLPFGSIMIEIDNLRQLLASDLVPEQAREPLADILMKATGQTAVPMVHTILPVKREQNGTLYVGQMTFEEVAASLLAKLFKSEMQRRLVMPPAEEPQSEPLPAQEAH